MAANEEKLSGNTLARIASLVFPEAGIIVFKCKHKR
jgi:hypothetical protein